MQKHILAYMFTYLIVLLGVVVFNPSLFTKYWFRLITFPTILFLLYAVALTMKNLRIKK